MCVSEHTGESISADGKSPLKGKSNREKGVEMKLQKWFSIGLVFCFLLAAGIPAGSVVATPGENSTGQEGGPASIPQAPAGNPADMAAAITENPAWITGSGFQVSSNVAASDVFTAPLTFFPSGSDAEYAVLTTGNVGSIPTVGAFASTSWGTGPVRGDTDFDVTIWEIDLDVPAGVDCLSFDFQFLSEEFPDFLGTEYNDAFIAELDTSDWTTSGSTITAPHNFAFDMDGNVISINSVVGLAADNGAGTAFNDNDGAMDGGATILLTARTPIDPGAHTLFLSIFDQGDNIYDSAVFLDNLEIYAGGFGCTAGVVGDEHVFLPLIIK